MLVYSQTATLANGLTGSFIYLPVPCRILTVVGTVQTAPAVTDFVFDIQFDGQTIFHTSPGPRILVGDVTGHEARPDRRSFQGGTKLQVVVTTASGATGPLHVVAAVEPGYNN